MGRSELDTIDHVLRGAFNTILLNLQLVSTGLGDQEQARPLIDRASSELRRVATVLLPAAMRILSLEVTARRPIDLGRLIHTACAAHGLSAGSAAPGPTVMGDAELLATAIDQLVANAVTATPAGAAGPEVSIEVSVDGGPIVVVRNVCGDPPPTLTAEGAPAARGHLGGVVTVMRVARLHGGALTYEREGHDLIARLSIPEMAAPSSAAAKGVASASGVERAGSMAPAARKRGARR